MFEVVFFADQWGLPLVVCQADVKSAHDCVNRFLHVQALVQRGYDESYVLTYLHEYANSKAKMTLPEAASSDWFDYAQGLRQGDPESSPQFDEIMDFVLEPLHQKWAERGLAFKLSDSKHPHIPHQSGGQHIFIRKWS